MLEEAVNVQLQDTFVVKMLSTQIVREQGLLRLLHCRDLEELLDPLNLRVIHFLLQFTKCDVNFRFYV